MYCQRCGKELTPGAAYCHSCGARIGVYSPADWWREKWERPDGRWERHDWDPMDAAWGAVEGVGYLIVIGLTIFYHPDVFTLPARYLEIWGTYGQPVLPPRALGQVFIFLFTAGGIWGVVISGARMAFTTRFAKPLRGIVGGVFSLYVAFILNWFYGRVVDGAGLVLAFFVGLAVMVMANALISHFLPRRWGPKPAPSG